VKREPSPLLRIAASVLAAAALARARPAGVAAPDENAISPAMTTLSEYQRRVRSRPACGRRRSHRHHILDTIGDGVGDQLPPESRARLRADVARKSDGRRRTLPWAGRS
jgi:hypothetical protein